MAEEKRRDDQTGDPGGTSSSAQNQTGDPGRTPGTAEGDEETVEEDLRDKGLKGER
ncbi:MAG TPA: hypothetical protein VF708_06660 [Pyrinomonadaceae bacterium]|jgi:hypothetical protein